MLQKCYNDPLYQDGKRPTVFRLPVVAEVHMGMEYSFVKCPGTAERLGVGRVRRRYHKLCGQRRVHTLLQRRYIVVYGLTFNVKMLKC